MYPFCQGCVSASEGPQFLSVSGVEQNSTSSLLITSSHPESQPSLLRYMTCALSLSPGTLSAVSESVLFAFPCGDEHTHAISPCCCTSNFQRDHLCDTWGQFPFLEFLEIIFSRQRLTGFPFTHIWINWDLIKVSGDGPWPRSTATSEGSYEGLWGVKRDPDCLYFSGFWYI